MDKIYCKQPLDVRKKSCSIVFHDADCKRNITEKKMFPKYLIKFADFLFLVGVFLKMSTKSFIGVKDRFIEALAPCLEYLCVAHYVIMFIIAPPVIMVACVYTLIFTTYWWVLVPYGIWFYFDMETPRMGGRPRQWYKACFLWYYYQRYFPMKLEKYLHDEVDLPADKNYLFGYHPHGVISCGLINLATNVSGFDQLFPGLTTHPLTLKMQFYIPFRREYIMLGGGSEVSEANIRYLMKKPGKGHVAIVVIGGAEEAIHAAPGTAKLVLNDRKGFIRIAIENG